ncbi:hypothetical protein ACVXG7_22310 [Enterobacter hormaechei]
MLRALGMTTSWHASIRFSLGRFTTEEEIDYTISWFVTPWPSAQPSPLWEMFKQGVDMNSIEWSHHGYIRRIKSWHTAKKVIIITKTRATLALSETATNLLVAAWSVRQHVERDEVADQSQQ